jgi:hypothetical protein
VARGAHSANAFDVVASESPLKKGKKDKKTGRVLKKGDPGYDPALAAPTLVELAAKAHAGIAKRMAAIAAREEELMIRGQAFAYKKVRGGGTPIQGGRGG